ncbi:hypothetical protein [Brevibacillus centrosporus]|uniref:Uncharacterized protein n=1 Tax=Brevibacillus centrosporus TaxID=54910 RepID=A0A1I3ZKH4_9BACL|nr:hypothetical protein [Brevibacillus centrosporus]SFK44535.1 hypothetical protein SAMN05518846_113134 [Brevibacillus centrosporus]
MNIKKILSLALLSALFISSIFPAYSFAKDEQTTQEETQFIIEEINSDEIDNYPDVKAYIIENGFESYLKNEEQTYDELAKLYNFKSSNEQSPYLIEKGITEETEQEIAEKYGLEKPEPSIRQYDQSITVKRSASTNAIDGMWIMTCIADNYYVRLSVTNLNSRVSNVSGTLTKFNAKDRTWVKAASTKVYANLKGSGEFFKWSQPLGDAVQDYFEYELVVVEGNLSYPRNNIGEKKPYRYYFDAEIYKLMKALGGERHHLVSANSLYRAGFVSDDAPAVRMMYDDHRETLNYGSGTSADQYRAKELEYLLAKDYTGLLQMEVNDFQKLPDYEGRFRNLQVKYYDQLIRALYLYEIYFGIR